MESRQRIRLLLGVVVFAVGAVGLSTGNADPVLMTLGLLLGVALSGTAIASIRRDRER